ncbi:LIRP-like [Tenebrio molitor]|nr:insulin-like peptide [Tenebrio molitor]
MAVPQLLPTKMDNRVTFVFFLLNIIYVWCTPHMASFMNKREVFCGPKLSDALALVCRGNYNPPSKKSMNDLLTYNTYDELFPSENDDDLDFPFIQKEAANSFLPMRFARSRGVVDECCKKPCTYRHLTLYCG